MPHTLHIVFATVNSNGKIYVLNVFVCHLQSESFARAKHTAGADQQLAGDQQHNGVRRSRWRNRCIVVVHVHPLVFITCNRRCGQRHDVCFALVTCSMANFGRWAPASFLHHVTWGHIMAVWRGFESWMGKAHPPVRRTLVVTTTLCLEACRPQVVFLCTSKNEAKAR